MAGFHPNQHYVSSESPELLPLRFEPASDGRYLVSNAVGEFTRLTREELTRVIELDLQPGDGLYEKAYAHHLISHPSQKAQRQLLALRLRSRMAFLREVTPLHLFVVTLRCEHSCPYCQVSRQSTDKSRFDMSEETARRSLTIALSSPTPSIKIEFQGGEPLLNFGLIENIVSSEEVKSSTKSIQFVIATNLALLTDDILAFCKAHEILLSTSLDGPADLHNKNRPRPGGNSHELAVKGIRRAQEVLGKDRVGALMTTTDRSLDRVEQIVDEYVSLGLDGIFLRPLSPYGFAVKTKLLQRYDVSGWMQFYKRGLRHILEINKRGIHFPEVYSALVLRRMLSDQPIGYVDLRSPAGAGLGALVYNYDGRVFASDEGRMLAEMGDNAFELGHVERDDYRTLVLSDKLVNFIGTSLTQSAPMCVDCAFEPLCGADPVFHHATQGDAVGLKPLSDFCARQKAVMHYLLDMLDEGGDDASVLRRWGLS